MTDIFYRKELIIEEFQKCNLRITEHQADQFLQYYKLLIEWNSFMNLTGITEFREVVIKHFVDSLALAKVTDLHRELSVMDVGTGAGFPGLPLKIVFPELKVTLLDSLHKRIKFLEKVILQLQLKDIFVIHGRAEDYGKKAKSADVSNLCLRESFDLCISRAVANIFVLSEYCIPFVKQGGIFVAYKSEKLAEEIEEGKKAVTILGGKIEDQIEFTLDNGNIFRSLLVIRKVKPTPEQYPRKSGTAVKNPII